MSDWLPSLKGGWSKINRAACRRLDGEGSHFYHEHGQKTPLETNSTIQFQLRFEMKNFKVLGVLGCWITSMEQLFDNDSESVGIGLFQTKEHLSRIQFQFVHSVSFSHIFVSPFLVMFHFNSNKIKKVAYSEVNRRLQRKSLFFDLTNRIIRVLLVSLIGNLKRLRFVNLSDNKLKLTETYRLRRGRL